jgi:hypothetical protein
MPSRREKNSSQFNATALTRFSGFDRQPFVPEAEALPLRHAAKFLEKNFRLLLYSNAHNISANEVMYREQNCNVQRWKMLLYLITI